MNSELQRKIALTWAERAQAELGARKRFESLTGQLKGVSAHSKTIELCYKAQREEEEHAFMCAHMARQFGHDTGFAMPRESTPVGEKSWNAQLEEKDQLLCDLVLMCCFTESINASLLTSINSAADEGLSKQVIHKILKDEVKHSQIGWAHLYFETQKRDCGFLEEYFIEMLDISVKDELFGPVVGALNDESSIHFGVLPAKYRLSQFQETMENIVIPGFEKMGLRANAIRKWLQNKQTS